MTNPKPIDTQDEVVGPAKVTAMHAQDRPATDDDKKPILGKSAWRKLTPLQRAFNGGQINYEQYEAGAAYSKIFDLCETSGRDSTVLEVISGGGGLPFSVKQQEAMQKRIALESHLSQRDRTIIRMVCGEAYFPSKAVAVACGEGYKDATVPRFKESLQALTEALEACRKTGFKIFRMRIEE